MRILTASDRALLIETADLAEAMRWHAALREARARGALLGVTELVPAARTVLVHFDPRRTSVDALAAALAVVDAKTTVDVVTRDVEIPVHYDGADLAEAAALLGVSAAELVSRHLTARWQVAFAGFAPGFGYLVGDDPLFEVPRRATPRTRVPAGAVGLAGPFTGVYPRESPGGWQLIGRTDVAMWDVDREPPALLEPGARVRFVRTERERVVAERPRPSEAAITGRRVEVVVAPLPVLVQDQGRPGHAALGVSASGVADRTAMRAANRAVGTAPDAAVLEVAADHTVLRFFGANAAAVTGAVGELILSGRHGEHPVEPGVPFAVFDGDELRFGAPVQGTRYVLATRGGLRAPLVLGSRATDTLGGLGPAPLRAGDAVALGDPRAAPYLVDPHPLVRTLPAPGETATLRVALGPRDDWFTEDARETLLAQEWEATARGDRVGIRLAGANPLERAVAGELASEGVVTGALQVPPDGQPVLFLPDHPLTGGYPVIAVVIDADLDIAAQLPPGSRVRFAAVDAASLAE